MCDPFDSGASEAISGMAPTSALLPYLSHVSRDADPPSILLLIFQCLAIQRAELQRTALAAEFIATVPSGSAPGIRPTGVVVREMVSAAKRSILTLGYVITAEGGMLSLLQAAASRFVAIDVVCDREVRSAGLIAAAWPQGIPLPNLFTNAPAPGASSLAKMHCKLLLVDSSDLLITSANFTFHGMAANIEFGIRVRGQEAMLAQRFFDYLRQQQLVLPVAQSGA